MLDMVRMGLLCHIEREGEKGEEKDRIPIPGPESALLYISAPFTDPWRALSNVINSQVKL